MLRLMLRLLLDPMLLWPTALLPLLLTEFAG